MARGPITFTFYRIQLSEKVRKGEVNGAIPVAARSNAWVCGCSLAVVAGSNPA
jgi:hypothetical protein